MSETKLKILTPTGVIIKDLEIGLGEYTSDFRILVEHDEYRVLYTKEVTTENQNKDESKINEAEVKIPKKQLTKIKNNFEDENYLPAMDDETRKTLLTMINKFLIKD